jgi:hypothetical protein
MAMTSEAADDQGATLIEVKFSTVTAEGAAARFQRQLIGS